MPYIADYKKRDIFDEHLEQTVIHCDNAGDLTYCFYKIMVLYIKRFGLSFGIWSNCVAALESSKLEFYRIYMSKYEDNKIIQNGDVK